MKIKFYFILLPITCLIFSCNEVKKNQTKNSNSLEEKLSGFWERIGTIQTVKGIAVDTVYLKDTDPDYRQIKVFHNGNVAWINNVYDSLNDWKSGSGMYGKFKIENNIITETISHATGGAISWLYNESDEKQVTRPTAFEFNINDNLLSYDFLNSTDEARSGLGEDYKELWRHLPDITLNSSKIDGVWKRTFEIQYVNNIPIDTVSVPNDGKLDIHFRLNGRFIYQVDNTGMSSPGDEMWWGHGGYGEYEFISENSINEYGEFFSGGTFFPKRGSRESGGERKFEFYSDDLFLQTQLDSEGNTFRGVVYERIK